MKEQAVGFGAVGFCAGLMLVLNDIARKGTEQSKSRGESAAKWQFLHLMAALLVVPVVKCAEAGTQLMALVDIDVLIDLLRGHQPTHDRLAALPETTDVPDFAALELYQGCRDVLEVLDSETLKTVEQNQALRRVLDSIKPIPDAFRVEAHLNRGNKR